MPAGSSHFTRSTGVFVLAATLIGAAVFVSPPAHASSGPVVVTTSYTASPTSITIAVGGVFIVQTGALSGTIALKNGTGQVKASGGSSCVTEGTQPGGSGGTNPSCPMGASSTIPFEVLGQGTVQLWRYLGGPPGAWVPTLFATITMGPGASEGGEGTASGPPDWVQMYGRPASGVCDPNFTPAWAKTPATPEGGWTPSWADWLGGPNMKPIGLICVRTLRYSPDSGRWVTV